MTTTTTQENTTMTTTTSPVARVRAQFPNAMTLHDGTRDGDPDSAIIEWGDATLAITQLAEDERYDVGVYPGATYDEGEEPAVLAMVPLASLEEVVDFLTEEQPDGTDWAAWATHWFTDVADFEVIR